MPTLNRFSANGTIQVLRPGKTTSSARDVATFYSRADALYRCAIECCRQHERLARLVNDGANAAEQRAAQALVTVADEALAEMAAAYEKTATRGCAERDGACWQAANALWMASREYARRQRIANHGARGLGEGVRSTQRLAELALDYDLEASALLFVKQATSSYTRIRPQAVA